MGTTAQKLNRLVKTKAAIKQAIIDKGVEVANSDTFATYPEKIAAIKAGGGSITAKNELGEVPAKGTKIFIEPRFQESGFVGKFGENFTDISYLIPSPSVRGVRGGGEVVYSYLDNEKVEEVYRAKSRNDPYIRYLPNNRMMFLDPNYDPASDILGENGFEATGYFGNYSGIVNENYATNEGNLYEFSGNTLGALVAKFPDSSTKALNIYKPADEENTVISFEGNCYRVYSIDRSAQTMTQVAYFKWGGDLFPLATTLDGKYLVMTSGNGGGIYKILPNHQFELDTTFSRLPGIVNFNPYTGYLTCPNASDFAQLPMILQYVDGKWIQHTFDKGTSTQTKFWTASVNSDCTYMVCADNYINTGWLYKLGKTEAGYKAVEFSRFNITANSVTAFVEEANADTITVNTGIASGTDTFEAQLILENVLNSKQQKTEEQVLNEALPVLKSVVGENK